MPHESDYESPQTDPEGRHLRTLILGAIGVVYGDIGTSPLYAVREAFAPSHGIALNELNVMGIMSMIIWSLILVVSVKYMIFILRADNHGEGGILALQALAQRATKKNYFLITCLGVFGASLFYSDGIITPAISVLSAVEGLQVATPAFDPYIVPIAIVIVVLLFSFQHKGTDSIGKLFGPVTCIWFVTLGALGLYHIMQYPQILWAFSPVFSITFFMENAGTGFFILGTVVLCITGTEALYADMGHFGRKPMKIAWLYFVMPCLMLNYLGQGAYLLVHPEAIENPFFKMVPRQGLYAMVALATAATVIASQAMISGAYSMSMQAIRLGFLPRIRVQHTSSQHIGQIYMPNLNLVLFIGVVLLILWYHSSSALASAYGIAVTGTMTITSILAFIVAWKMWNWSLLKTILLLVPLLLIDAAFFTAALTKLSYGPGAWVPLALAVCIYTIMLTWYQGKIIKDRRELYGKEKIVNLVKTIDGRKIKRVAGGAIYMTRSLDYVPPALALNLRHYKVLHEKVILVRVETSILPRIPDSERLQVKKLNKGFVQVTINYGFMQPQNVPRALGHLKSHDVEIDLHDVTYFMNRVRVLPTPSKGNMWLWREKLYAVMHRNAAEASDFYQLPVTRVLELGSPVTI